MKVVQAISVVCMLFGALLMLGTAGGSDLGRLSFSEILTYSLISTAMMIGGFTGIITTDAISKSKKSKHNRKKGLKDYE